MTDSNFRGPVNSVGAMLDGSVVPTDGPSYTYQGTVFPSLRGGTFQKDGTGAARVPAYMDNPAIVTVDNIPSPSNTTAIVATATGLVSGTVLTLVTVAPGSSTASVPSLATGVPFIPFGGTAAQNVVALDFGFTTGTTTAANSAIVVADNTLFTLGQWLCVGGAGNSGKTAALLTQVTAISTVTTNSINVFPIPLGTLSNAPIGAGNLFNQFLPPATQYGPSTPVPIAEALTLAAGLFRVVNPVAALSRVVSITATAAAVTGLITVRGFDVHSQAMSEAINVSTTTAGTFYGKKAFKYIASVTPGYTDATGSYSVGTGDTFGLPIRMDRSEYLSFSWNGINKINQTGFIAAVTTSPATATTGDVRGTLQVSGAGNGTSLASNTTSNGVARLFIVQTLPLWNTITGTPTNTAPFYGVTEA